MKLIPIQIIIKNLIEHIYISTIEKSKKDFYSKKLSGINIDILVQSFLNTEKKISNMDIRYIACFLIEMNIKDIGLLFDVDTASVRTARYRIRKKFGKENTFRFLL